jgi:NitT/TauT family transport system ATP-binding protein
MTSQNSRSPRTDERMTGTLISFEGVHRVFAKGDGQLTHALGGVSFTVSRGEFVSVLGPSGCGKSTLLNLAAGLMKPDRGAVTFDGSEVRGVNRRVGYVTQHDSLLPWRTVRQNIALALQIRRMDAGEISERVTQSIELVGLEGFENHYPAELSGGMRRRVSLARTMVYQPETLLLDEPFGALDAQLRLVLQSELCGIVEKTGVTVVFVTHDVSEAVALSDRVVVLTQRPSRVQAVRDIDFERPRNIIGLHKEPSYSEHFESLWEALRNKADPE